MLWVDHYSNRRCPCVVEAGWVPVPYYGVLYESEGVPSFSGHAQKSGTDRTVIRAQSSVQSSVQSLGTHDDVLQWPGMCPDAARDNFSANQIHEFRCPEFCSVKNRSEPLAPARPELLYVLPVPVRYRSTTVAARKSRTIIFCESHTSSYTVQYGSQPRPSLPHIPTSLVFYFLQSESTSYSSWFTVL